MKTMTTSSVPRRQFLKQMAAVAGAAAFPQIIPSSVLGKDGATAPSNKVTLGCIGLGIQGLGNMRTFRGMRRTFKWWPCAMRMRPNGSMPRRLWMNGIRIRHAQPIRISGN